MTTTTETRHQPNRKVICIDSGRLRFAEKREASAKGKKDRMEWSGWRNHALVLANPTCSHCFGLGHRFSRNCSNVICKCVFRQIFCQCMEKFRSCVEGETPMGRVSVVSLSVGRGTNNGAHPAWALKNEEYMADFQLLAFRTLNDGRTKEQLAEEGVEPSLYWQIFTMHMILGAQWNACCQRLNMDRGNFFHAVYRIQCVLGLAFADTEPHALFPLDEYFSPMTRRKAGEPIPAPKQKRLRLVKRRAAA